MTNFSSSADIGISLSGENKDDKIKTYLPLHTKGNVKYACNELACIDR